MKEIIKDSVSQALVKFKNPRQFQPNSYAEKEEQKSLSETALQWDKIAIKSAIEFCLAINSTQLLFQDIY